MKKLLAEAIAACKRNGKYIGICGQGPSDHPDLTDWLMELGIDSMSLNPDTVVSTWMRLAGRKQCLGVFPPGDGGSAGTGYCRLQRRLNQPVKLSL